MKQYQVTLNYGRTDTIDLSADSMLDVKGIYENLSNASIRTIKEVVYFNPSPTNELTNFHRELKVLLSNRELSKSRFITIRFVKPLLKKDFIIAKCKQFLQVHDKQVNHVINIIRHGN